MRYAAALTVLAVALAAAVYVHERTYHRIPGCASTACYSTPSWANPVAVLLALGGLAVAVAIVRRPLEQRDVAQGEQIKAVGGHVARLQASVDELQAERDARFIALLGDPEND